MNEQERNKVALFRYGIIAPLVTGTYEVGKSRSEFFRYAAKKIYINDRSEEVTISEGTIERWHRIYTRLGFDGLKPQRRSDTGKSRKLDEDVIRQIHYLKEEYPRIPATLIYEKLKSNGTITSRDVSLSTVNRYINQYHLRNKYTIKKDMRRYEREHRNEVWCGDSSVGPYMSINGKKQRIYIICLLDDATRYIVGIHLFTNDNFINLMSVMKSAVSKFGKPTLFNFDNGSNYKNKQMTLLSARLGTNLNYCAPYTPESKAKIERFFKTLKSHWAATLRMSDYKTIDEVRESLYEYINSYHQTPHSSLNGLTPHERFFRDSKPIKRMQEDEIEKAFLLEIERRVSNDNVVVIDGIEYEVHYRYAKQRITLRYSPDLSKIYVVEPLTGELNEIKLLNKLDNAHIKREKVKLTGGNNE